MVDLRVMPMKRYSTFPKARELEPDAWAQFQVLLYDTNDFVKYYTFNCTQLSYFYLILIIEFKINYLLAPS